MDREKVTEAIQTLNGAIEECNAMKGDRHIVVLDRGFIFVGNLVCDSSTGEYTLTNCVNIRKWKQNGFGGLTRSAKDAGAVLDPSGPIKFFNRAVIFTAPISEDWDNGY